MIFDEAVEAKDINLALADLDISVSTETRSPTSYRVRAPLLASEQRVQARQALESEVGALNSVRVTDITDPTPDQMEGVLDTISRRINAFGTEEPIIQRFGDDRIIVQLPGASGSITQLSFNEPVEGEDLWEVLSGMDLGDVSYEQVDDESFTITSNTLGADRQAALLNALENRFGSLQSFRVASGIDEAKKLIGQTARLEFKRRTCADTSCNVFEDSDIGLTGDQLENAFAAQDNRGTGWVINIQFDDEGSQRFSDLTRAIAGVSTERIAVFMDGKSCSPPWPATGFGTVEARLAAAPSTPFPGRRRGPCRSSWSLADCRCL